MDVEVLQWRKPELTESKIEETVERTDHQQLLLGPNVQNGDFEEFKNEVVRRLYGEPPVARVGAGTGHALIFVDTETDSRPAAQQDMREDKNLAKEFPDKVFLLEALADSFRKRPLGPTNRRK